MTLEKILIVDDDGDVRAVLTDLLRETGFAPLAVSSMAQAREEVRRDAFDLILCDVQLEDGNGLDFLTEVREKLPKQKMMIMTGFASMDSAVKAIRIGVFDYLIKPIDPSFLEAAMHRLNEVLKLEEENRYLRREATDLPAHKLLKGESDAMQAVFEMVEKAGQAEATVLIQGESGTGKEMIARALCDASPRADKPFIKVNCAAVPATLMESEFFGHEKGAFTGAVQRRMGRFELADGGTLLLDEITEIPQELQVKLLRALQEREFERVGGQKTLRVDVRVIATTNRDIKEEVAAGQFREDLYYRLNVFPIHVPPLRTRGNDIAVLSKHFLKIFARQHRKPVKGFAAAALERMKAYSWPGNVRELQNIVERAVILSGQKTRLELGDLALPEKTVEKLPGGVRPLAEVEKEMIHRALECCEGNRTRAARMLGISLRTMRNRLREYREGEE